MKDIVLEVKPILPFSGWKSCMCCLDANGDTIIGNIKDKSLQAIIEDTPYQQLVNILVIINAILNYVMHCLI